MCLKKHIIVTQSVTPHTIIAIHNHPSSSVPSIADLRAAYNRKYKYGLIACHNGTLMRYEVTGEFDEIFVGPLLDRVQQNIYTDNNKELLENLNELLARNIILEVFR